MVPIVPLTPCVWSMIASKSWRRLEPTGAGSALSPISLRRPLSKRGYSIEGWRMRRTPERPILATSGHRRPDPMCNLYSLTKGQAAISAFHDGGSSAKKVVALLSKAKLHSEKLAKP